MRCSSDSNSWRVWSHSVSSPLSLLGLWHDQVTGGPAKITTTSKQQPAGKEAVVTTPAASAPPATDSDDEAGINVRRQDLVVCLCGLGRAV